MAKQIKSQAEQRRDRNLPDQFGRKWLVCLELATGEPTGGIIPAGFTDPLHTPQKYLKIPRDADGQPAMDRMLVDIDLWITEFEEADRAWLQQLMENAQLMYKRMDRAQMADLPSDPYIVRLTGPRPKPNVAVLRRAKAGYKPFLGLAPLSRQDRSDLGEETYEDMQNADPLPAQGQEPEQYHEFIQWSMKERGVSFKEALDQWKAKATAKKALQPA